MSELKTRKEVEKLINEAAAKIDAILSSSGVRIEYNNGYVYARHTQISKSGKVEISQARIQNIPF